MEISLETPSGGKATNIFETIISKYLSGLFID